MKELSPVNDSLLRQRLTELDSIASWEPHILSGLERFIRTAGDYDLFRVNPVQYATATGLSEAEGIELFVHAAKVGLFEMQWLLTCAYCPQVAGSFRELDQVHPRFQCEFCNALNDVTLDDYIQVTFTVSNTVRDIVFRHPEMLSVEDYYLRYNFSKGFKPPHGMTHEQLVAALSRGFADIEAGQQRSFEFDVTAGRFEVLDLSHKLLLVFFATGEPAEPQGTQVRLESGRFTVPDRPTGPREMVLGDGRFAFRQTADLRPGKHIIQIENRTRDRGRFWFLQYPYQFEPHLVEYEPFLSGRRLLLTPCFGELYKTQLVDERESLAVSDITYLFTDLKDSTPLYESVGDVNAYFLVRQHFDILNKIIRERSGIMVKTIGDAVMAGFERPQDAVLASIEMVEELSRFNQTASRPLGLKVGVHRGRAIAVRLNDRIDYFGQDVNIAARVQGLAGVNEVCLTESVMEAPGVSDIVKGRPASRDYENLKGIGQKMEIYRIEISPA
ncbi:adenylate/guanylate cyclase domain-containing protein [Bradyrhizobium sp. AUGA SZCCT0222]|uniref:adenylate/guanylate cyclase domain-containing protein n=1 Tax=Bradyrhizobium sp. AUGA SZCCT0222 TaxID=2807668 RepID=UPI001BA83EC1|nr:adenylate/guanylate cyclase domain-containing protein [Bradyrhizobium sp. AUGA SZCCT0222]MBR1272928.1 adenylate/guanylate cyclase domain-containing protein [Bradyrhizobium sp. AUGA SZCCT0222]